MKVAILKSGLGRRGGLEKYTEYTARAFADRGCDVTILTSTPRDLKLQDLDTDAYRVVSLGHRSWLGFKHRLQFDRWCHEWLEENPCEIVFGMDRNTYQTHYRVGEGCHAAYLERRRETEPFIKALSFRINPLHLVNLWLEKKTFLCPYLKRIFTNSHMVRNEVLAHYPVDPSHISVVHNGVEWHELQEPFDQWPDEKPLAMQRLGLDPTRKQFLFAGHGWRRKGLAYLLHAIAKLPQNSYQLSIVGREKYPGRYYKLIEKLKLQKNAFFFPPQQHLRQFLQVADCMVIPSVYDPFANVTVEALAMGVPIITTHYNGAKEILTSTTGKLISSLTDINAFAKLLEEVPRKTPEVASEIRKSVSHLDFSKQLTQMIEQVLSAC